MERDLVQAILADDAIIAVTGKARPVRKRLLDHLTSLLTEQSARVIRVESADEAPLDLPRMMEQVIGRDQIGGNPDRVERFFEALTLPQGNERHLVLIIDDAHTLTMDTLSYLALIGPTTVGFEPRLRMVFAGSDLLWDRLPRTGNLSRERITTRFVVEGPVAPSRADPTLDSKTEPEPPGAHEDLRVRLVRQQHQRQYRTRLLTRVLACALLLTIIAATAILWHRFSDKMHQQFALAMPATRVEAPIAVPPTPPGAPQPEVLPDSPAVAALVNRGRTLVAAGDILAAQLVFAQAAAAGSGPGAAGLGMTYDPLVLARAGARGVVPDRMIATAWYQRAVALGDPEAAERLSALESQSGK